MQAEIIANGDEIVNGKILDTNSQWLSSRLEDLGIRVMYHTAVGDDLQAMVGVFRQAIERSDVVVGTGGLGPTADDLTREALANATGRQLIELPEALEHVQRFFAERQRPMPERNRVQAAFPMGSEMIHNPNGTAPGIAMAIPREGRTPCHFFCLPGIPAEVYEMWPQVEEYLRKIGAGKEYILHRDIKCFGAGESQVEAMLPDLIRRGNDPLVGINASKNTIILRISAKGSSRQVCEKKIKPVVETIYKCLGDLVFGEDEEELQDVVLTQLVKLGKTLAIAEVDTGGMVADWLSQADRQAQGNTFRGGIVLPAEGLAQDIFSASSDILSQSSSAGTDRNKVSSPPKDLAGLLSARVRRLFHADIGLAASAMKTTETPRVVSFAVAIDAGEKTYRQEIRFGSHPDFLRLTAGKHMLNTLRLWLGGKLKDS
ncbi:MAG: CinA family nicotinamide mononucleotide deamidase-related protein [Thermogutta sp.]